MKAQARLLFTFALMVFGFPAFAQTKCGPVADIVASLRADYNETPVVSGVVGTEALLILSSPDGATWTILRLRPSGLACFIGAGTDLAIAAPKAGDPT